MAADHDRAPGAGPAAPPQLSGLLLLLLDSRAPTGAHSHSGGMEPAITAGVVRDLADVEWFCGYRLRTAGRVAAAFAAAACTLTLDHAAGAAAAHLPATAATATATAMATAQPIAAMLPTGPTATPQRWAELDAEFDARTPSAAIRSASRQLGSGLRRLLRAMLPDVDLTTPWSQCPTPAPHHPLVLGAGVALAGGTPELAATAAALGVCTGPASAAVRLLGLDPFAVQAMLARLTTARAELSALGAADSPRSLAADAAPALDLLADVHLTAEVRLFAS